MRYLWDFYHAYRNGKSLGTVSRPIFTVVAHYLRLWDAASAARVDHFVANSQNVAARIRKHYRRESTVIHPPVKVHAGYLADRIEDYYMVAGQLVDYKRFDLAIEACNRLGRRLHIVGEGEQWKTLRRNAGPTIKFCGALSDEELREQYAHCRALLFAGEEDFGIIPVEALSFGRPVDRVRPRRSHGDGERFLSGCAGIRRNCPVAYSFGNNQRIPWWKRFGV